jgi:hypothetical protein
MRRRKRGRNWSRPQLMVLFLNLCGGNEENHIKRKQYSGCLGRNLNKGQFEHIRRLPITAVRCSLHKTHFQVYRQFGLNQNMQTILNPPPPPPVTTCYCFRNVVFIKCFGQHGHLQALHNVTYTLWRILAT